MQSPTSPGMACIFINIGTLHAAPAFSINLFQTSIAILSVVRRFDIGYDINYSCDITRIIFTHVSTADADSPRISKVIFVALADIRDAYFPHFTHKMSGNNLAYLAVRQVDAQITYNRLDYKLIQHFKASTTM
jgi:hypothetical protein